MDEGYLNEIFNVKGGHHPSGKTSGCIAAEMYTYIVLYKFCCVMLIYYE